MSFLSKKLENLLSIQRLTARYFHSGRVEETTSISSTGKNLNSKPVSKQSKNSAQSPATKTRHGEESSRILPMNYAKLSKQPG
jgi:hypothetical protein